MHNIILNLVNILKKSGFHTAEENINTWIEPEFLIVIARTTRRADART
jgi:hypothetical protein